MLDNNIEVTPLNNYTPAQIENEVDKWLTKVKTAMGKSIPRSNYRLTYQTSLTPQIRTLEREFNELSKNAQTHGWTINNYRQYIRIRQDLREECKREHNKRWEESIDKTIQVSTYTKAFWRKIKQLQGNNIVHNNYLIVTELASPGAIESRDFFFFSNVFHLPEQKTKPNDEKDDIFH